MIPACTEQRIVADDGAELFASIEDFTPPGRQAPVMLLVHGFGESSEAWREWLPVVGADFRIVRPDIRGFGRSTPMAADYVWSMQRIVRDLLQVIDACCGGGPVHLVGAKSGAWMSMKLAAEHPQRVRTLTAIGGAVKGGDTVQWRADLERIGVAAWAEASMPARFGTMLSPAAIRWWIELTGRTPMSTMQSYLRWVPTVDITDDVKRVGCPTLVIAAAAGKLRPIAETKAWQQSIVDSDLVTLPCDGWHVGGARPRECAQLTRDFALRRAT